MHIILPRLLNTPPHYLKVIVALSCKYCSIEPLMQPLKITLIKKKMFSLCGNHYWLTQVSNCPQISHYLLLARASASGIKGFGTRVRE